MKKVKFNRLGKYAGLPGEDQITIDPSNVNTFIEVSDKLAEYALASEACTEDDEKPAKKNKTKVKKTPPEVDKDEAEVG